MTQDLISNGERILIETKIKSEYGSHYEYIEIVSIDSVLKWPNYNGYPLRDSYGTLSGMSVFIATGPPDIHLNSPKAFIGFFKNGEIVWRSENLTEGFSSLYGTIFSAMEDLNNDGNIDFIIAQNISMHGEGQQLWVFTWDGKTGKNLTEIDEDGDSKIVTTDGYTLEDVNNDQIKEIITDYFISQNSQYWSELIYSWNGKQYGNPERKSHLKK